MTSTDSFVFLSSPLVVVFSGLVVLATGAFSAVSWRRSGFARSTGLLELFRLIIVLVMAALLNQPEWVQQYRPDAKPTIAVLWDDSRSMGTEDVVTAGAASAATSRREQVKPLTESGFWQELGERFDVQVLPFGRANGPTAGGAGGDTAADVAEPVPAKPADGGGTPAPPPGAATNLHDPLLGVVDRYDRLAGVVLISDGDWNDGPPPVQAAATYRLRGAPILTIPVGSTTRLPDLELVSVDAPTFGVAGKQVRIPITIDSSLPRDHVARVELTVSTGEVISKPVRIAAMGRTTDALVWRPSGEGEFMLEVSVPQQRDERTPGNNRRSAPISIRQEELRVLVVESYPRWEYRFLRNALSRDPGVAVSCLLFHPNLKKRGGGNSDYIKQFPDGLDELAEYDVVFLGDVGADPSQLSAEQCRLIKGLVGQQASGLVLMPGWQGRQFSLLDTELADLYPVQLDGSRPRGYGSARQESLELTAPGRRSLLTKLADTAEENAQLWRRLPGFQWYAPVLKARPGSEVLCVHDSASNRYGRLPLLVTRTFGAGKVLFMGTDGAWRWRKGVEDKYHYRFWGQVVRWMAYQRNMARGERVRLYFTPDQPRLNQSLTLNANVLAAGGEPLSGGDVTARVVAPSGKGTTVRFSSVSDEWGAYVAAFQTREPGEHRAALRVAQTGDVLETSFYVQGDAAEPIGKPARPEVLEEIARVSRGRTIALDRAGEAVRQLAKLPDPAASVRRLQIWSHPLVAGVVTAMLGAFWVLRKAAGLI